jgi:hypothetical protein
MGLGNQREPVVLQTLNQIHLPQRPRSIEPPGQHSTYELSELSQTARARQRRPADMEGEVEILVIGPYRSS